eukprot:249707_1
MLSSPKAQNDVSDAERHIELTIPRLKEYEEIKEMHQYNAQQTNINMHTDQNRFVAPKVDDYINCDKGIHHCATVTRILILLAHYKNIQSDTVSGSTVTMYEYIMSIDNNYKLSNVMEDWHHFKTTHTLNKSDIKYLQHCKEINCVNTKNCMYLNRYQRDRSSEIHQLNEEIDHKNLILRDQMDSIHTYIFHSCASRLRIGLQNKYMITNINENQDNISQNVWHNQP